MRRSLLAATALLPLAIPGLARAQADEQTLVDRATLAVQELVTQTVSQDPQIMLRRSRAVMICPRIFKAGFFFGGSGGNCVLLARAGNGTWSYPAFYAIGSGSFGLQIGIEDSSVLMTIMTQKGLNAVMDSQFKLGAGASIAVATIGAGVQGSTTAAIGADIVAFSETRGLYGGISLEGSIMSLRSNWNAAYYGHPYSARQIVIEMQGVNAGADPLREVLTRYGTGSTQVSASTPGQVASPTTSQVAPPANSSPRTQAYAGQNPAPPGTGYAPAYPPAYLAPQNPPPGAPVQLQPNAPIQQQNLPPPR